MNIHAFFRFTDLVSKYVLLLIAIFEHQIFLFDIEYFREIFVNIKIFFILY